MPAQTANHTCLQSRGKLHRVRHDRVVASGPDEDGSGMMRDAQTAKPQIFRTGDGWFAYNLAANLAQIQDV